MGTMPSRDNGSARRNRKIGKGALVFLFSPADKTWMDEDPWANGLASSSHSAD